MIKYAVIGILAIIGLVVGIAGLIQASYYRQDGIDLDAIRKEEGYGTDNDGV